MGFHLSIALDIQVSIFFFFFLFTCFLCNQTEDRFKPNEAKQELKSEKKNKSREQELAFSSKFGESTKMERNNTRIKQNNLTII